MNYLKGKRVYLCGSIHSANDEGTTWRDLITPKLTQMGIEVLDPCKKNVKGGINLSEVGSNKLRFREIILTENWGLLKKEFWPIIRNDLRAIDFSDFAIINYDTEAKMVGTIHELVVATFEKKVVLLKYDKEQLKDFNPWMATFIKEHHFFAEWDGMFDYLKKVNDGVFDTSLWVI